MRVGAGIATAQVEVFNPLSTKLADDLSYLAEWRVFIPVIVSEVAKRAVMPADSRDVQCDSLQSGGGRHETVHPDLYSSKPVLVSLNQIRYQAQVRMFVRYMADPSPLSPLIPSPTLRPVLEWAARRGEGGTQR